MSEKSKGHTTSFVTVSAALHTAAVVMVVFLSPTAELKTETLTVELPEVVAPLGENVPENQGSGNGMPEVATELPEAAGPAAALPAVAAPKSAPAAVKAASSARVAKSTVATAPMTTEEIQAPALDASNLADSETDEDTTTAAATPETPAPPQALNEELNEDFAKVDQEQKEALVREEEKIAESNKAAALEHARKIEEAKAAEQAQEQAEEARQKKAQAAAAALAAAQAEKAAQAQAAREQREQAAATAAANAAAASGTGEGHGENKAKGLGAGQEGNPQVAAVQPAGEPTGVRRLEQLQQVPGNPKPTYSPEERLRGDQGRAIFYAYISKEGLPSQFRLVQSTGFRNLDGKTLSALKKWRFQPGQEGWVELPFQWDLKGEAQDNGGRLRSASLE